MNWKVNYSLHTHTIVDSASYIGEKQTNFCPNFHDKKTTTKRPSEVVMGVYIAEKKKSWTKVFFLQFQCVWQWQTKSIGKKSMYVFFAHTNINNKQHCPKKNSLWILLLEKEIEKQKSIWLLRPMAMTDYHGNDDDDDVFWSVSFPFIFVCSFFI